MREVLFKKYIFPVFEKITESTSRAVTGTGCFSDFVNAGRFHQWGIEAIEVGDTVSNTTVGIIEDMNGFVHSVTPHHIQFVNPGE